MAMMVTKDKVHWKLSYLDN